MMTAERTALHCLSAVAGARQAARAFLEALGRPAICRERADTVVLVVSELVTNALRHGGGAYTLRLAAHPGCIEVAFEDPGPRMPRMRTPTSSAGRVASAGTWSTTSPSPLSRGPGGGMTVRALLSR
ncbi:ATP-binding protein [Streptomyces lavendulae]|uniref:ATP-binding protein n=1 Tax=Streptomyces lavendulae TaxID=1914 RepID=UPI0031E6CD21